MTVLPRTSQFRIADVAPRAGSRATLVRVAAAGAAWVAALALTVALASHIERTQFVWFWMATGSARRAE